MLKSGQTWTGLFVTKDATGALVTPSAGPVGTLYVNGVANAAVVTISGANPYVFTVTLPTITAGQSVSLYVTATVGGIATAWVVAEGIVVAIETQLDTIQAHTDLIGAGAVVVVAPVLSNGDVEIVRGDVYKNTDGRRLEWSSDDWNIGATSSVVVVVRRAAVLTATRLSATSVGLELTSEQSEALPEGERDFWIQEIQSDGEFITLLQGTWTTEPRPIPVSGA